MLLKWFAFRSITVGLPSVLLSAIGGSTAGCDLSPCSQISEASRSGWAYCLESEPVSSAADETCCGGLGWCLEASALTASQTSRLAVDSCARAGQLCVPKDLAVPGQAPPHCLALGQLEGRCLPDCLPGVSSQDARLAQTSCAPGNKCVPCFDALTGLATGACDLGSNDAPSMPPKVFDSCCSGAGRCIPPDALTEDQKSQVDRDTCPGSADFCVPTVMIDPGYVPPSCRAADDAEGRCLSTCLASIGAQAAHLSQATCTSGELCAPCFDPITGDATGACTTSPNDHPTQPPTVFASCCAGAGKCISQGELTATQTANVQRDSCAADSLCVPEAMLSADFVPPTCASVGGGEGRCLSTCLPVVSSQASKLSQATCASGELCAPCFDPITGDATGACTTSSNDHPTQPPYVFPGCCSDGTQARGKCIPTGQVPASEATNLSSDTCASTSLCVPNGKVENPNFAFPSCTLSLSGAAGACVPDCLPATQGTMGSLLTSAGCQAREKCVPCINPLTGAATGACS